MTESNKFVNSVKDLYRVKSKKVISETELVQEIKEKNIDFLKYPLSGYN